MTRIVYLSWPAGETTGGIKMAFRHVEALRAAGYDSVIGTEGAQPPNWFETTAPIIDVSETAREEDVLIFPENHNRFLERFSDWPNRKVILCQNQFMVYRGVRQRISYADYGVNHIICVGRKVASLCQRRFPSLEISIVPVFVDHKLFQPRRQKKLQIAFFPRKRPFEVAVVQDLFRGLYPDFRSIPWIAIHGKNEIDVAHELGESAVFLSLCRFEAAGLTLLEALASGCICAGFTGQGAGDYTNARNGFWVDEDDCESCADKLAEAVKLAFACGPLFYDMMETAVRTAAQHDHNTFRRRLVQVMEKITTPIRSPASSAAPILT